MSNGRYYLNNFMQNFNKLQNEISFYLNKKIYTDNAFNLYRL